MRFARDELDIFDGLILLDTMNRNPLVFLALPLVNFLQRVDSDLSIKRASCDDGSEFRTGPFDLPG